VPHWPDESLPTKIRKRPFSFFLPSNFLPFPDEIVLFIPTPASKYRSYYLENTQRSSVITFSFGGMMITLVQSIYDVAGKSLGTS
jgi:hypothetical protein